MAPMEAKPDAGWSPNAVRELTRSEELFRVAVEASPSGTVIVDEVGTILLVNREIERLFGYGRDELVGRSIDLLIPPASHPAQPDFRSSAFGNRESRPMGAGSDLIGRRRDGTSVPVEIGFNAIETDDGPCVLASIVDITVRKRAEEALRRSNEELVRFAYVASHDLQEPLRTVASYVQLLERRYRGKLDSDATEFIAFAVEGAKRMQRLIDDLLAFARLDNQAGDIVPTSSAAAVDTAIRSLDAAMRDSGAVVVRDELPAVLAEPSQLQQLFTNLIGNALKFHGSAPPSVRISAERNGTLWRFSVTDNGIGIEPRYFDRIFVIFQRLHAREDYAGTGIGLAICRKIIEHHGGRIWVESTPGQGSTFSFTLSAVPV